IGVQAEGAAPLAAAFASGRDSWTAVEATTVADGIAVGDPFFGRPALEAVRASEGEFVTVSDELILSAVDVLARSSGLLAEPAGAAALAGLVKHCSEGKSPDGLVVVPITGSGLKDQRWLPRKSGRTVVVGPDLTSLQALFG